MINKIKNMGILTAVVVLLTLTGCGSASSSHTDGGGAGNGGGKVFHEVVVTINLSTIKNELAADKSITDIKTIQIVVQNMVAPFDRVTEDFVVNETTSIITANLTVSDFFSKTVIFYDINNIPLYVTYNITVPADAVGSLPDLTGTMPTVKELDTLELPAAPVAGSYYYSSDWVKIWVNPVKNELGVINLADKTIKTYDAKTLRLRSTATDTLSFLERDMLGQMPSVRNIIIVVTKAGRVLAMRADGRVVEFINGQETSVVNGKSDPDFDVLDVPIEAKSSKLAVFSDDGFVSKVILKAYKKGPKGTFIYGEGVNLDVFTEDLTTAITEKRIYLRHKTYEYTIDPNTLALSCVAISNPNFGGGIFSGDNVKLGENRIGLFFDKGSDHYIKIIDEITNTERDILIPLESDTLGTYIAGEGIIGNTLFLSGIRPSDHKKVILKIKI